MYRPADHYAHGAQVDPAAEAELREWAFSEPCEEPEWGPVWRLNSEPMLSVDDYAEWQGMAPSRGEFRG